MTQEYFPNGFDCWQETHYEVVEFLTKELDSYIEGNLVTVRYEQQGRGGMYELAQELTNEFELLNKGREWDGDFFDEIETFLTDKIKIAAL